MKNLNIFYFDNDLGNFDNFNPRYVMEQKWSKQILTILCKRSPYFYTLEKIQAKLKIKDIHFHTAIKNLENINAIHILNNTVRINFPYFNSKDIKILNNLILPELLLLKPYIIEEFKNLTPFIQKQYPNTNIKESLYHLICGRIFDGLFFDYLESQNILQQSFHQKDNRDYLIIGYENSKFANNFNKQLFCSFNHAKFGENSLTSFGNADGERFDYFRYFKLRAINKTYGKFKKLDKLLALSSNQDIIKNSLNIIQNNKNNNLKTNSEYYKALQLTSYIDHNNNIAVPVFHNYKSVLHDIYKHIVANIGNKICESLTKIKRQILTSNLSSIKNKIDINHICNEVWHMYFGLLNKYLIEEKIVARPKQFYNQGKYLKCVYLSENI